MYATKQLHTQNNLRERIKQLHSQNKYLKINFDYLFTLNYLIVSAFSNNIYHVCHSLYAQNNKMSV